MHFLPFINYVNNNPNINILSRHVFYVSQGYAKEFPKMYDQLHAKYYDVESFLLDHDNKFHTHFYSIQHVTVICSHINYKYPTIHIKHIFFGSHPEQKRNIKQRCKVFPNPPIKGRFLWKICFNYRFLLFSLHFPHFLFRFPCVNYISFWLLLLFWEQSN